MTGPSTLGSTNAASRTFYKVQNTKKVMNSGKGKIESY